MILKDIMAESANYTGYVVIFFFSEIKEINTVTVVNTFQHIIFLHLHTCTCPQKQETKEKPFFFLQSAFSHYANMSM